MSSGVLRYRTHNTTRHKWQCLAHQIRRMMQSTNYLSIRLLKCDTLFGRFVLRQMWEHSVWCCWLQVYRTLELSLAHPQVCVCANCRLRQPAKHIQFIIIIILRLVHLAPNNLHNAFTLIRYTGMLSRTATANDTIGGINKLKLLIFSSVCIIICGLCRRRIPREFYLAVCRVLLCWTWEQVPIFPFARKRQF